MKEDELALLAYTSVAAHDMTHEELIALLNKARENNKLRDVTGMLLYMDGCFFQVLEGQCKVLDDLYEKISQDSRHHHVMKLIEEPLNERGFSAWTMGYQHVTREELSSITGLTDFLDHENSGFEFMQKNRARQLIEHFRGGRWQNKMVGKTKLIHMGA